MTPRLRRLVIFGTPLVTAVLMVFHPGGEGRIYDALEDDVTRWLIVHIAFVPLIALMGLAVWLLLNGLEGRAAKVSRIGVAVFAPFYIAYEGALGIGTGVLMQNASDLPASERETVAGLVQDNFESPIIGDPSLLSGISGSAWIVAMIAAAVAFRLAGEGWGVVALLVLSIVFLAHPFPIGPVGLVAFATAAVLIERRRASATRSRTSSASARGPSATPSVAPSP
jgi:hypothetical protein